MLRTKNRAQTDLDTEKPGFARAFARAFAEDVEVASPVRRLWALQGSPGGSMALQAAKDRRGFVECHDTVFASLRSGYQEGEAETPQTSGVGSSQDGPSTT